MKIDYIPVMLKLFLNRKRWKKENVKRIGEKVILNGEETQENYERLLKEDKPFMVARFGSVELDAVDWINTTPKFLRKNDDIRMNKLCNNAGFFPNDLNLTDKFYSVMMDAFKEIDMIGFWMIKEMYYLRHLNKGAKICRLSDIQPPLGVKDSWIKNLEGKKVLVIHPFEKSIQSQYARKDKVFPDGYLPDFELKTLKAVQTVAGEKDERFETWFDALDYMKREIDKIDFDVAILGCGAYGFPLAAYIKQIDKQAIHMGGATQLLFGIIGGRWEEYEEVKRLKNEYWVRPLKEETPRKAEKVEGACYW